MQLSFDAADRLVELVEARHGPVPAEDAAQELYALRHVPVGLARCCSRTSSRATPGSPGAARASGSPILPGRHCALEDATYVVFDLETTGLSPGTLRDLRDRRRAGARPRAGGAVRDARRPAPAAARPDRGADRDRPGRAAGRAAGRARACGASSSSRATPCSSPKRALRPRVPRPRGRAADGPAGRGGGGRHRVARAAAARRAADAGSGWRCSPTSSGPRRRRATAPCRTPRRRRRSCSR